jgi:hypothetical protein
MYRIRPWRALGASIGILAYLPTNALAAGGPYVVDDAAVGNVGECQVESWASFASNGDFIGTAQPACVVSLGIPVEITAAFHGVRFEGEWAALKGLQIKFPLFPFGLRDLAAALVIGGLVDTTNGESLTFVNVPLTIKVRDDFRLNVNSGWLFNTESDTHHLTWGGSLEWDFQKSWTLIAEVFGLTGNNNEPRLQAGIRYAPTKSVDVDIVYGHNITGEQANWITAGLTVRF